MAFLKFTIICLSMCLFAARSAHAQDDALQNFHFVDMTIQATSGTTVLQTMKSEEAHVAEDGISIIASDVMIEVPNRKANEMVTLSANTSRYFFKGETSSTELSKNEIEQIQEFLASDNFVQTPEKNDLLLYDQNGNSPVRIDLGTQGEIICQNLYWNEASKKFISGGFFIQTIQMENEVMKIRGGGFVANQDFSSFEPSVGNQEKIETTIENANS